MEKAKTDYVRPSWDEYFMSIAELVGSRGTCDRGRSGCVIVRDKRILVTGYVGSPAGLPHCDDVGHEMHKVTGDDGVISEHCVRTAHAELNAIAQAAKVGVSVDGSTVYCHMVPCYTCAKTIVNAGIKKVVALKDYHRSQRTKEIFEEGGVRLTILTNETEDYKNDRFKTKHGHHSKN
jgi:dCMP deaminase